MRIYEWRGDKKRFMELLLLADEQEDMIDRYLSRGTMYVLDDSGVKAQCVVTNEGNGVAEIKSISVLPGYQKRGYGRALIEFVAARCKGKFTSLIVGTGDSPLSIPFYEKCAFKRSGVIKNFFLDNYDHIMTEGGVQLVDMIILTRPV